MYLLLLFLEGYYPGYLDYWEQCYVSSVHQFQIYAPFQTLFGNRTHLQL